MISISQRKQTGWYLQVFPQPNLNLDFDLYPTSWMWYFSEWCYTMWFLDTSIPRVIIDIDSNLLISFTCQACITNTKTLLHSKVCNLWLLLFVLEWFSWRNFIKDCSGEETEENRKEVYGSSNECRNREPRVS